MNSYYIHRLDYAWSDGGSSSNTTELFPTEYGARMKLRELWKRAVVDTGTSWSIRKIELRELVPFNATGLIADDLIGEGPELFHWVERKIDWPSLPTWETT